MSKASDQMDARRAPQMEYFPGQAGMIGRIGVSNREVGDRLCPIIAFTGVGAEHSKKIVT